MEYLDTNINVENVWQIWSKSCKRDLTELTEMVLIKQLRKDGETLIRAEFQKLSIEDVESFIKEGPPIAEGLLFDCCMKLERGAGHQANTRPIEELTNIKLFKFNEMTIFDLMQRVKPAKVLDQDQLYTYYDVALIKYIEAHDNNIGAMKPKNYTQPAADPAPPAQPPAQA